MRKSFVLTLIIGFLLGSLFTYFVVPTTALPDKSLSVEFINSSEVRIDSLQLNFGYAEGQSSLLSLRLKPGEARTLLLNHEPGAGFNVTVQYADGLKQDFCANRGKQGQRQQVILQR